MINLNGSNLQQPSYSIEDLENNEKELRYMLVLHERDIYLTENNYIHETQPNGNVFKGFKEFNAPT